MSEMQEWKDMEDMIKRVAEKEPLPESLAPEEIEKKLKAALEAEAHEEKVYKTDRKNRKWMGRRSVRAAFLAVCLALLVALSAVLGQGIGFRDRSLKNNEEKKDGTMKETLAKQEELREVLVGAASKEEVFERIDRIKNPDKYKDVGDWILDGISGIFQAGSRTDKAMSSETEEALDMSGVRNEAVSNTMKKESESYSKTNLQEQGVDEADIVKNDGKYFYIKQANEEGIAIVQVEGEQMNTVSRISLPENNEQEEQYIHEFYVTGDQLVLLKTVYTYMESLESGICDSCQEETRIVVYDISDRKNPQVISELSQDGAYASSRMNGNYLYTFSDHYIYDEINKDVPESYMPSAEGEVIACQDIYVPEEVDDSHYKVLTSLKLDAPESFQTKKAVLCGGSLCYVSTNAIYFLGESYVNRNEEGYNMTEIWKFSYQDGNIIGSAEGTVKGALRDQFAISEADGYLRVVTTYEKNQLTWKERVIDGIQGFLRTDKAIEDVAVADVAVNTDTERKNGLFILDENLNVVGSLEDLAAGETIYSARFFADTAYFVTFRQTDPLFSVDVSDPANPMLLGELKIPGFSEYLHPYGEGRLLGIGYETDENGTRIGIKLSMFDISDPANVKEIDKKVIVETGKTAFYTSPALSDYKAVLVDVEKNLIGCNLNGEIYSNNKGGRHQLTVGNNAYVVYGYDEEQGFYLRNKTEYTAQKLQDMDARNENYEEGLALNAQIRGAYIGKYFYTINQGFTIRCFDMEADFALKSEYEY